MRTQITHFPVQNAHPAGLLACNAAACAVYWAQRMMELTEQDEARLLAFFGKRALRSGQREVIAAALAGLPVLGVLPTGHGKSLCYQAAALLLGGVSVVVSPLIALMRDQVESLRRTGLPAARFDSTLPEEERRRVAEQVASGELRLLFLAPEALEHPMLVPALHAAPLRLLVVDEAHCVSEWGHSFRPDYLKLPAWAARCGFRSVMALTATAAPRVQQDLCAAFGIAPQQVVALSPYRPNIVRTAEAAEEPTAAALRFLRQAGHAPAIVYTRTRKGAEEVAAELSRNGVSAACYHAGQPAELRARLQDAFLRNELPVLVATIAFGMGVDKPDVRAVLHYNAPSSPESYVQESGRAGRDGQPAYSHVLLHVSDLVEARNRIMAAEPDAEGVLRCVRWLLPAAPRLVCFWELGGACDVAEDVPQRALERLAQAGAVQCAGEGYRFYKVRPLFPLSVILDGRDAQETARLRWLAEHPEGEVEDAAEAWQCDYAEAMQQLQECRDAGEWSLTLRRKALLLVPGPNAHAVDARRLAAELSASFARRREADLARQELVLSMLTEPSCLNAALADYFSPGKAALACGHCAACLGAVPARPCAPAPALPSLPATELPDFDRTPQLRRFLLGISSPASLARRLWSHPLYGSCQGIPWHDLPTL